MVFNSHYLLYADEAATAWFGSTGTSYGDLLRRGLDTMVKASTLEWSSSARWGEVVDVDARCERVGRTSFVLALVVRVGDRTCCTVRTTYVLVDAQGRPTPVPADLRAAWTAGTEALQT